MALNTLPSGLLSAVDVLLLPSAARAASGTGTNNGSGGTAASGTLPGVDQYSEVSLYLDVTAASGTTPTLDVYIQKLMPDKTAWTDLVHFAQVTGVTNREITLISGGAISTAAAQDAALTANTIRTGSLGDTWRVKYVIGGTNPSFTFSVAATFKQ